MAGCKKDQPEINNEEILWQQLQNDSMFNALVNIDFITPAQDKLIWQRAGGSDSSYKAAIKPIYMAKLDSVNSLMTKLKTKYIGFTADHVKKARALKAELNKLAISLALKKKMYNDPIELNEVQIASNCALSYQRYGGSFGILSNVYQATMSICGNEDVYLAIVYDKIGSRYAPSANLSYALIGIGKNQAALEMWGGCATLINLIKYTEGNAENFEANFPIQITPLNDMYSILQSITQNCQVYNEETPPDNRFWVAESGPPLTIDDEPLDPLQAFNKLCSSSFFFSQVVASGSGSRGWKEASVKDLTINVMASNYFEHIWNTISGGTVGKFSLTVGVPGDLPSANVSKEAGIAVNKAMVDIYRSHGSNGVKNLINTGQIGTAIAALAQIQLNAIIPGSRVTNGLSGRVTPHEPVIGVNCP
ncbi:MAG: hypothetical protein V4546_01515 [Bacteroidota bacterium]